MATAKKPPAEPVLPPYLIRGKDKVAIVGFAHTRVDTPFDDPEFESWGINRLHGTMPDKRWDRYFQIHDIEKAHGDDEEHLKWLRSQKVPVYLRPDDLGKFAIPAEVPFPKDLLVQLFGQYFTNTISWLLGLAIFMEFKTISVFGVDMAVDTILDSEYAYQRPSCEFFLGIAAGQGIELNIPAGSDLLKATHLYGFETGGILREKYESRMAELTARTQEIQQQVAVLDQQRGQMIASINQVEGAKQDVQYWLRNWAQSTVAEPPDITIGSTTGDT